MVTIDQSATGARAQAYQDRFARIDWRRLLVSILLAPFWFLGSLGAVLVVAGTWLAAATAEGFHSTSAALTPDTAPPDDTVST